MLNGVNVGERIASAKAEDLNPAEFAKIENVEIRREFVRKVGIERIVSKIGAKTIDKAGDGEYELLSVDLGGSVGVWPYLKKRNRSIGCYHLEAVDRACSTVESAIKWRNQATTYPSQLT